MNLSPKQKKQLKRVADALAFEEKGAVSLLELVFALEDKLDTEIPEIRDLIDKVKSETLSKDEVQNMIDIVVSAIEIPKAIQGEKGEKGDAGKDGLDGKDGKQGPAGKDGANGINGKDADESKIINSVENNLTRNLPKFGEQFRDGLERLQKGERLKIDFIDGIEDYPEVARLAKASQFLNRGGNGKGLLSQQNDVSINTPTNNQVLKYNITTKMWENGAGGGGLTSFTSPDDSLVIGGTLTDPTAEINYAHSGTYTASQTFLEDTIFSDVAPLNGHELKLVSYLQHDVLYDASWSLGHGNTYSVPDTNQVVVGNNNTMQSFVGFITGIGNSITTGEDVFLMGMNNTSSGTSSGAALGIANTLGSGSNIFAMGVSNSTGAFINQIVMGLNSTTGADNTIAIGLAVSNSLTNSLDIGISNTSKLTLSTSYAQFRTDVGIGTTPSAGLHVLKTTEQLRLGYDASNYVTTTISSAGLLSWQTTAGATAGVYTLTPHGSGGSGTNRTLSFGNGFGNPALWLYSNGSTTRHGWGMQADAMQFFQPSITGAIFTWNRGGDLQATGTNELMRLVQFASGKAGLSIPGAGSAFNATTPYKFELDGESLAGGTAGVQDIIRFRRGQTGGVSYPEAFSIGLGRYSSSGVGPDTRVDFSLKSTAATNFTTNAGVMSLNSNGRVLIGAVGAATAILDLSPATTAHASLRVQAGTAPTSPNDGDIWYENTNDRLMFRKNATSSEILSASAVTTEVVVSDTTLTITYNGVTYKLLAKA